MPIRGENLITLRCSKRSGRNISEKEDRDGWASGGKSFLRSAFVSLRGKEKGGKNRESEGEKEKEREE